MATYRKRGSRWEAQIRLKGYPSQTKTFQTKRDAVNWAQSLAYSSVEPATRSTLPPAIGICTTTVRQLLERYKRDIVPLKRSAAIENSAINHMLKEPFCDLLASELTPNHLAAYRDSRLQQVKPASFMRSLSILRHALSVAITEWGIPIASNPVHQLVKPKILNSRIRRLKVWERSALDTATKKCRNKLIGPLVHFAIATGLRRSEILQLEWSQVDLDAGIVVLNMTKNGKPRHAPLSPVAISILKTLPTGSGRIFPVSANALRLSWTRLRTRAGIENLTFHDLRHEAISHFFELGLSTPEVAIISGHADARMLFRYTHMSALNVANHLQRLESHPRQIAYNLDRVIKGPD